MVEPSGTVVSCNDGRHVLGIVGRVGIHVFGVGVEVAVGMATHSGHFGGGYLLVAGADLVGVVACRGGCMLGVELEVLGRTVVVVAKALDHGSRLFALEGAAALGVGALLGREDGLLGVEEVVVLNEDTGSAGGSNAVFGHVVEVVVPHVDTHGADAGMAGVGVVEPVVVVADVVGTALALHAEHVGLAGVPEAAVADGDELGVGLQVDGTVAFGMVAAAVRTVEKVRMVQPDVGVVGVERDAVVHAAHDADVTHLDAPGIAYEEAEAFDGSIVANALDGDVEFAVGLFAFDLESLARTTDLVEVVLGDKANETEGDRGGVVALLVGVDDGLYACAGF